MYKIDTGNKYKMKGLIRNFVQSLAKKYVPSDITKFFNITFSLDNHLAERVMERKVNKQAFERLITGLIKYHLCEIIYLSIVEPSVRINLFDKTGLLLGVTGTHYEDGVFNVKLHTCFVPNNPDSNDLINTKRIYLNKGE